MLREVIPAVLWRVDFMLILQELWYGNINSSEDKEVSDDENKLVELIARHQAFLTSRLKDKELDEFKKYIECVDEYTSLVECPSFENGFKLAFRLLNE